MAEPVEIRGLEPLIRYMQHFPKKLKEVTRVGMEASLLVLWENVPPYPARPVESSYRRTGTLGRTLGSSPTGGNAGGKPSIYQVKNVGSGMMEGRFGTNLSYAEFVIGENRSRYHYMWWTMETIKEKAKEKIDKIWQGIAQKLADFLDQRGGDIK